MKGGAWREVGGGEAFILKLKGRRNDGCPTGSAKPVVVTHGDDLALIIDVFTTFHTNFIYISPHHPQLWLSIFM